MYGAQLASFLISHHHINWATEMFTNNAVFLKAQAWAIRHGFVYQP